MPTSSRPGPMLATSRPSTSTLAWETLWATTRTGSPRTALGGQFQLPGGRVRKRLDPPQQQRRVKIDQEFLGRRPKRKDKAEGPSEADPAAPVTAQTEA